MVYLCKISFLGTKKIAVIRKKKYTSFNLKNNLQASINIELHFIWYNYIIK